MRKFAYLMLSFFWLLIATLDSSAQSPRTITGRVLGDTAATPVAGVSVTNQVTKAGTQTDADGNFTIQASKGHRLIFSYVGYTTATATVGDASSIDVKLTKATGNLDEVVVVGYGTQRRGNVTGAVSTVNVEKTLGSRPLTDIGRGLQGAVPGLTITTSSGDIGTNPAIRLRGLSGSLNGPGAQPLILVDNVELPDLRMINPDDIESISVLKDAASASIYGTRAAWGVILITTKSGKKGVERNSISYSNNFSFSRPTVVPEVASGAEGAAMALSAMQRTSTTTTVFGAVGYNIDQAAIDKMRDWQKQYGGQDLGDEMVMGRDFEIRNGRLFFYRTWDPNKMYMRDWTPQQNHNLTISGSTAKTGYTLGLGYLGQKGVLKVNPDEFERLNINLGVTSSVTNWFDARAKVILSRATRTRPYYFSSETYDPWYYLSRWPSFYPYGTYQGKPFRSALTEVQQASMTPEQLSLGRIQIGGTFKIARGLTFDADYTFASNNYHEQQAGGSVSAWDFWSGGGSLTYGKYTSPTFDRAILSSDWNERNTIKAYATYNKDLGDHDLKFIAGTDVETFRATGQRSERRGLLNPEMAIPNLAAGEQLATGNANHWATAGYFGRMNYAFRNKLLFEVNGRYDASSYFPTRDRWAFFPSVSAGYIITEEKFMDFAKPVLSNLKLRGSWGSIGNQALGITPNANYRFLSLMPTTTSGWVIGNTNMLTAGTPGLVSPSLTWERVTTLDFGTDARFFKSSLGVTFDWYKRTTSDMITAGETVPGSLGTSAPAQNYGELQTTGWELAVDWNHKFNNNINFNVTAILSDFQEKLSKFANTTKAITSNYEGKVLGEIWGYQTDRFFTQDDFVKDANGANVMKPGVPTQTRWELSNFLYGPGDIKYKDLDGDGKIDVGTNTLDNPGDQRIIGNSTPRYQYGLRLGADWKGFDINLFIQGVAKRDFWANGPVFIPGFRPPEAWYQHQLDYWTPENPNAFYPRPTNQIESNATRNFLPQTKYMLNMAYTRLKNINVGYTLPLSISKKVKLKTARIYLSGENLFTIDNLSIPIDPEVNYTTSGLNDTSTFGRVYPYRKTYSLGVQITL